MKSSSRGSTETKQEEVQRFGMVVGLKKDKVDRYNELHANPWPEINAMIKRCNIRNYSIYECEIDGKLYLFSYFEYVGNDFRKDMAVIALQFGQDFYARNNGGLQMFGRTEVLV